MRQPIDRSHQTPDERERHLAALLVDLSGRLIVVAGGGAVAERRVRTMLSAGATVRVIAREACSGIVDLAEAGLLELQRREFDLDDAEGAFMLIAATDDDSANERVREAAAHAGCLLNAAHDPDAGDVVVPAEMRQGRLRVTVSTSGASPSVARRVRDRIASEFGPRWQRYLDTLAQARREAQGSVSDPRQRHDVLEALGSESLQERFFRAEMSATELLGEALRLAEDGHVGRAASAVQVSLVGAGPGDPGLITRRGLELLRSADVVIYDYLVDERIIAEAREDAELIYVGKRGGHHHRSQQQINELLVEKATAEKPRRVVRLKGGDPFMFGRGGEEAIALADAGVSFELVPGVSAGYAAAEAAGIPITQRGVASSVTFVTGHEDPSKEQGAVDWERMATASDTLCIFMGVKNLERIVASLVAGGRSPEQPVAIIRWGTTEQQEVLTGTLADIAEAVSLRGFEPPAVVVVGDAVSLRDRIIGRQMKKP